MGLIKNIKGFIYKSDFFYTTELLRYKQETQYRTLFGGVLSLAIIISLIVLFYNMLIDTVNKVIITSSSYNVNSADPLPYTISTFDEGKFMFGVQIWHHDLNNGLRYFDIQMVNVQLQSGIRLPTSKQYTLQQCKPQHWAQFPQIAAKYDSLNMSYWMCLPKNTTYDIQGKYSSSFTKLLKINVKQCKNSTKYSRPCAPQSQIDRYMDEMGSFVFTVYFINPLINPSNQQYLSYYLEDTNYIDFTKTFGGESLLFIQDFTITTDESILPFIQQKVDTGGVISQYALKNPFIITTSTYCSFAFFKSGNSKFYSRKFQKIDALLAYIGGLFGTITIFFFMVNTYNGHSFQVTLGESLFQKNSQLLQQGKKPKHYHFLTFLAHQVYSFLDSLGCPPNWKFIRQFHSKREEMVKQLDILYLLERVSFLQSIIKILLKEHQLKGLYLHGKISLLEAKKHRRNFRIKKSIQKLNQNLLSKGKNNQTNKNTLPLNELNQSLQFLNSKTLNTYNFQPFNISQNFEIKNDAGSKILADLKKQLDETNKKKEYLFEQSSDQSSQENEDQQSWMQQILILQNQAETGQAVSKKIWQGVHPQLRQKISKMTANLHQKMSKQKLSIQQQKSKQINDYSPAKIQSKPRRLEKIKTQTMVVKRQQKIQLKKQQQTKDQILQYREFKSNISEQNIFDDNSKHLKNQNQKNIQG